MKTGKYQFPRFFYVPGARFYGNTACVALLYYNNNTQQNSQIIPCLVLPITFNIIN